MNERSNWRRATTQEPRSYLIEMGRGQYLQRRPYDGAWLCHAPIQHATAFDRPTAEQQSEILRLGGREARIVVDPMDRPPTERWVTEYQHGLTEARR